jgi:hypothetical protein
MKEIHSFTTLRAAALLAAATLTTHAQTWETLLPNARFAPTWEGTSLLIDPFSVDPANPEVFVGCSSDVGGSVLHLDNSGVPTFVDTDLGIAWGMGFNPTNSTLYAVGEHLRVAGAPSSTSNQDVWSVRKSIAEGAPNTWMQDDTFSLSTRAGALARAITTDARGNVYVCGTAYPASGNSHWVVRELPLLPVGASWGTVVDTAGNRGNANADAHGMLFFPGNSLNPTKAVFAVGTLNSQWTVMRSQDQGASWQIVDAWSPGKNIGATADKAACDGMGNIYVVGYRGVALTGAGWVVRKSSDGGNTWSLVLDVSEGTECKASSVAIHGADVWVTGFTCAPGSTQGRWTVLKNGVLGTLSANNSAFPLRELPFGATLSNPAGGVHADSYGNVFVTGVLFDSTGSNPYICLQRLVQ